MLVDFWYIPKGLEGCKELERVQRLHKARIKMREGPKYGY